MKIWCDACNKTEATIFCSADEAALCDDCDIRVHQANKLASKHQRLSLLQSSNSPQCDICQEKKALLFCQQDRAVLCRDCDISIHTANELTSKHNRFLLTGAKLSGIENKEKFDSETTFMSDSSQTDSVIITQGVNNQNSSKEGGYISSISEYLMEMLPGWQVEDLLDSSSDPVGFYKDSDDDGGQWFLNADLENNGILEPSPLHSGKKNVRKKMNDVYTVPEISSQSKASKRSRTIRK